MNILRSREAKRDEDAISNIGNSFEKITDKVVETTAELSEKSVDTIKKYPLHTAVVAGAVGLIVGALASRK